MQCIHKNVIYHINKRRLAKDLKYLSTKKWLKINLTADQLLYNTQRLDIIADKMTKGKEWVYFNRTPKYSKYPLHRQLYDMGYFDREEVGCGKCEICRTQKSRTWSVKADCEGRCWKNKTFITLTYDPEHLPKDRKLHRPDIQKFWKRLRYHTYKHTKGEPNGRFENMEMEELPHNEINEMFDRNYTKRKNKKPIRYINCGEYGPKTKRPHYHAVIYNFRPDDLRRHSRDRRGYFLYTSKKVEKIWGMGFIIIGNATTDTAAYVARYCTKKMKRTMEEEQKMKEKKQIEFIGASSWGFIGYYWWINHKEEAIRNQGILINTHKGTHLEPIPKVMQKYWEQEDEIAYLDYKENQKYNQEQKWKEELKRTDLSEKEYMTQVYNDRLEKLVKLRRDTI